MCREICDRHSMCVGDGDEACKRGGAQTAAYDHEHEGVAFTNKYDGTVNHVAPVLLTCA